MMETYMATFVKIVVCIFVKSKEILVVQQEKKRAMNDVREQNFIFRKHWLMSLYFFFLRLRFVEYV